MAKKKMYTSAEKLAYHKKRGKQDNNKGMYSRKWVDGFTDKHADHNVYSVVREYTNRRVDGNLGDMGGYYTGYINGAIAQLREKHKK